MANWHGPIPIFQLQRIVERLLYAYITAFLFLLGLEIKQPFYHEFQHITPTLSLSLHKIGCHELCIKHP